MDMLDLFNFFFDSQQNVFFTQDTINHFLYMKHQLKEDWIKLFTPEVVVTSYRSAAVCLDCRLTTPRYSWIHPHPADFGAASGFPPEDGPSSSEKHLRNTYKVRSLVQRKIKKYNYGSSTDHLKNAEM